MRNPKDNDFADRRSAAAEAKAALINAHRVAKEAAEPKRLAREAERLAVAEARNERHAERAKEKLEEQERAVLKQAAIDTAAKADEAALEKFRQDGDARDAEDKASRKAERDRRYANRKARQR